MIRGMKLRRFTSSLIQINSQFLDDSATKDLLINPVVTKNVYGIKIWRCPQAEVRSFKINLILFSLGSPHFIHGGAQLIK